ncbi:hypothetical protein [Butyrivibrio sp. VCD2006]|uniref:hypothetical protein n=1 Tax=Butyrivibrio sp. VCD2006 TaxID=1280664 RepID=UPI0003F6230B|nr:hypothetical protein [Butyrivibrio sp. VCD2006]
MNKKLKRYAGVGAIFLGVLLTWEAAAEVNIMFMVESIGLTITGMCYALPVADAIKHLIVEAEKTKAKRKQSKTVVAIVAKQV